MKYLPQSRSALRSVQLVETLMIFLHYFIFNIHVHKLQFSFSGSKTDRPRQSDLRKPVQRESVEQQRMVNVCHPSQSGFESGRSRKHRTKLDRGRIFAGQHVSRSTPSSKTSGRVVVVARHNAASATQIKRHA